MAALFKKAGIALILLVVWACYEIAKLADESIDDEEFWMDGEDVTRNWIRQQHQKYS